MRFRWTWRPLYRSADSDGLSLASRHGVPEWKQTGLLGVYGGQTGTGTGSFSSTSVFPRQCHSSSTQYWYLLHAVPKLYNFQQLTMSLECVISTWTRAVPRAVFNIPVILSGDSFVQFTQVIFLIVMFKTQSYTTYVLCKTVLNKTQRELVNLRSSDCLVAWLAGRATGCGQGPVMSALNQWAI